MTRTQKILAVSALIVATIICIVLVKNFFTGPKNYSGVSVNFSWQENETLTPTLDGDTGRLWLTSDEPFTAQKGKIFMSSRPDWDSNGNVIYVNNRPKDEPYEIGQGTWTMIKGHADALYTDIAGPATTAIGPANARLLLPLLVSIPIILSIALFLFLVVWFAPTRVASRRRLTTNPYYGQATHYQHPRPQAVKDSPMPPRSSGGFMPPEAKAVTTTQGGGGFRPPDDKDTRPMPKTS